jgi:hypothetical protein
MIYHDRREILAWQKHIDELFRAHHTSLSRDPWAFATFTVNA